MTIEITLTKYTLDTEISRNEWSTLYRARRKADDAPVAVRVVVPLFATDDFFIRRFINITQQCAEFEHPNIWPVQEAEQADGHLYLVQDWIEARPLTEIIEAEGPLSIPRTQRIAAQLASALDYAHQTSIMHGDLSTHQVYLGPEDQVWIANFGLSQLLYGTNFTKHGLPLHGAETLAPERVRGEGPSRQSDLYSLGVLCYQMLSKNLPFNGPPSAVLHAQAYKQPRPLHQANPAIPLAVSETIERMLSKSVDVRYNTGAEFARALLMAYQRKKSFRSYDRLVPLVEREKPRRNPRTIIYSFIGGVAILAIALLSVWTGYEIGLKHSLDGTAFPGTILSSIISTPPPTRTPTLVVETDETLLPPPSPVAPDPTASTVPTATEARSVVVLSDSLLPTRRPTVAVRQRLTVTPTLTLTPTVSPTPASSGGAVRLATAPTATPVPAVPAGQSLFVFYNPTGFDLIIDINGPTTASTLVPPDQRQEFSLPTGPYQYIIHTPAGNELPTKVGSFEVAGGGQLIERDYYSQHDVTVERN